MVVTTGTDASRQAYSTAALTSGNVLCTWTTSGRYPRSVAVSSRWDSRLQTTRAGSSAFWAADQCSMSSLFFSKRLTSCPARASASVSWSTTRFSPLGMAERYRLWTTSTRMPDSCPLIEPPLALLPPSLGEQFGGRFDTSGASDSGGRPVLRADLGKPHDSTTCDYL